jgi:nitrate reductase delta subunit
MSATVEPMDVERARSLRALAALLGYPTRALREALPEIREAVTAATLLSPEDRARLCDLADELAATDELDACERYVALFDRGRSTSLCLFEHVHGDARERGQAMVDLTALYERAGLRLTANELPDHLPVVLEYLSCCDAAETRAMIEDFAHIVRKVGETLARHGSRYAAVPAALLALGGQEGLDWQKAVEPPPIEPPIDDDWAETPAFAPPPQAAEPVVVQVVRRRPS